MSFSFIYLIFVLNETHFCIILTRTYTQRLLTFAIKEKVFYLWGSGSYGRSIWFPNPNKELCNSFLISFIYCLQRYH